MAAKENVIRFIYNGILEKISFTGPANYEQVLGITLDRFKVPREHMNSLRITIEGQYVLTRPMFEKYISWFPNPKRIFHIHAKDESAEFENESGPVVIDVNNRRRKYEAEQPDQPETKRLKISKYIDVTMKRLAKRRRSSLRI